MLTIRERYKHQYYEVKFNDDKDWAGIHAQSMSQAINKFAELRIEEDDVITIRRQPDDPPEDTNAESD